MGHNNNIYNKNNNNNVNNNKNKNKNNNKIDSFRSLKLTFIDQN